MNTHTSSMPRARRHALRHGVAVYEVADYAASFRGRSMPIYYTTRGRFQTARTYSRAVEPMRPIAERVRQMHALRILQATGRDIPGELVSMEIEAAGVSVSDLPVARFPLVSRVQGEHCGVEIPTVCRFGDWNALRRVCSLLQQAGAKVTKDCGGHVHIDVRDLLPANRRVPTAFKSRINRAVLITNHVLRWAVPRSRIGNRYCQLLPADWRYNDRYRALNVLSIAEHGTVEIRLGGASLNPAKWAAWVAVCRWLVRYDHAARDVSGVDRIDSPAAALAWVMASTLPPASKAWLAWRIEKFHPGTLPHDPEAYGPESRNI